MHKLEILFELWTILSESFPDYILCENAKICEMEKYGNKLTADAYFICLGEFLLKIQIQIGFWFCLRSQFAHSNRRIRNRKLSDSWPEVTEGSEQAEQDDDDDNVELDLDSLSRQTTK